MRIAVILLAAFFGIPMLIGTGLQLYAAYVVADIAHDVSSSMKEAEKRNSQAPSGDYNVVNLEKNKGAWSGYRALTQISEPVRERSITFSTKVPIREFLKPGEEMPEKGYEDLFVEARAGTFAQAECAEVLKTLAKKCEVGRVSSRPVKGRAGDYDIHVTLYFVQKDNFGKVKGGADLAYREVRQDLGASRRLTATTSSQEKTHRARLYKEAARSCQKLRDREGNCAIYRLYISENQSRGSSAQEIKGIAQLSFLQAV